MVAAPPRPDNVVLLSSLAGIHVDQVYIGSCAGGRMEDLRAALATEICRHYSTAKCASVLEPRISLAVWAMLALQSISPTRPWLWRRQSPELSPLQNKKADHELELARASVGFLS